MEQVSDHLMAFSVKQGHSDPEKGDDKPDVEQEERETPEEEPVEEQEPVRICFNRGHTSKVWSLAWSPDGMSIVSGSEDNTAQVWNGRTGKQIRLFRGHTACVTTVAWSPDGQWIASGGCDNIVFVWNARTGDIVTTYAQHTAWICNGLAWSPDGAWIASSSWDGTVHIWEAMTGKTRLCYNEHHGVVTSVAWSPNGTQVVSGGGYPECAIHVWNAATGQRSLLYKAHMQDDTGQRPALAEALGSDEEWVRGPSSLRSLAWSPDGRWIASVGLRNVFRVWNAQTGEDLIAKAQNRTVGSLAWSPDSTYVATGQRNGIDFWNIAAKKITVNYTSVSQYEVIALAWSPDRRAIATGVKSPRIGVWKVDIC
jgi:WD40 repeat protein